MYRISSLVFSIIAFSFSLLAQVNTGFTHKVLKNQKIPFLKTLNLSEVEDTWQFNILNIQEAPKPASDYQKNKELLMRNFLEKQSANNSQKKIGTNTIQTTAALPVLQNNFDANIATGIPNDNTIAVSKGNKIISMVNQIVRVYDDVGTQKMGKTLNAFSFALGNLTSISDPRLIYDPVADRFISVYFNGSTSATSKVVIGFSQTNDPATTWKFYALSGNYLNDTTWSDYPIISITNDELFITFNQLISGNSDWRKAFRYSIVWQINKQDGYSGNANLNFNYWYDIKYNNKPIWNVCPVQGGGSLKGPECYFLSVRSYDLQNDTVFLHKISNTLASGNATFSSQVLKTNVPYGLPPNAKQKNTDWLQTNDARVLSAIIENNKIQYVHNTVDLANFNSAVYHGTIDNVNSNPVASGYVYKSDTMHFAYPAIAYAGGSSFDNGVMITCSYLPYNGFPGTGVFYQDYNGNYSNLLEVKKGNSYVNVFTAVQDSMERWGDYNGIQPDYNKPGTVWLNGSYKKTGFALYSSWNAKVARADSLLISTNNITDEKSNVMVYPNPTLERITVEVVLDKKTFARIELFDLQGKQVAALYEDMIKSGTNEISFNVSHLKKGIYFLQLTGDGKVIANKKIIKN